VLRQSIKHTIPAEPLMSSHQKGKQLRRQRPAPKAVLVIKAAMSAAYSAVTGRQYDIIWSLSGFIELLSADIHISVLWTA